MTETHSHVGLRIHLTPAQIARSLRLSAKTKWKNKIRRA